MKLECRSDASVKIRAAQIEAALRALQLAAALPQPRGAVWAILAWVSRLRRGASARLRRDRILLLITHRERPALPAPHLALDVSPPDACLHIVYKTDFSEGLAYPMGAFLPTHHHDLHLDQPASNSCWLQKYMAFLTVEPLPKFHENLEVCEFLSRGRECSTVKP
jgi:hypothetical protein